MSATTADPFDVQVGAWVAKAKGNARAALVAIAEDALARVKELTPVRTGYLRANWTAVVAGEEVPLQGQDVLSAIIDVGLGQTIVILNPVVYARRVEFGFVGTDSLGRHYNQHGAGMMQQTIAEMPAISRAAVARVMQQ